MRDREFRRLASDVVSVVIARGSVGTLQVRDGIADDIVTASVSRDPDALSDLVASLRRTKFSVEALADHYIPDAARRLGNDWTDDKRSFVEVSIGVSRLQALLRQLGAEWASDVDGKTSRATVLLYVPEPEDHTLGAVVAAGQFRRLGVSVALRLKVRMKDVELQMAQGGYDALLISWANVERLESLRKIVETLRRSCRDPAPIIVGGACVSQEIDVRARSGADHATNDVSNVVSRLGIAVPAASAFG